MVRPALVFTAFLVLSACASGQSVFVPKSDWGIPPTPRDYTEPGDCKGGSRLAAREVDDPVYPPRAFKRGQQGWVALRLDVAPDGRTRNVKVVDALPSGPFNRNARRTVQNWTFQPPGEPGLTKCVVILDYRLGVGRIGF